MTAVHLGFESAVWSDPNRHNGRTSISHYSVCEPGSGDSGAVKPSSIGYTVREVRTLKPDVLYGQKSLSCALKGSVYWGRMPSGNYRFRITAFGGGYNARYLSVTVRDLRIRW